MHYRYGVMLTLAYCAIAHAEPAQFVSEYTNLTGCKAIVSPQKAEGDFSSDRCPGRDGYTVHLEGGDNRTWLVLHKGKQAMRLPTAERELYFPLVGEKLEWRYRVSGTKKELVALIFRMGGNDRAAADNHGNFKKWSQVLCVVRPTGSDNACLIGTAKTNEEARRLADSGKECVQ